MNKSNIFKIVSTYISIILGAGFISGKELFFFFGKYKYFGIFSILLTSLLFLLTLNKQLTILKNNNINNYSDFSNFIYFKNISSFIEIISLMFLFVTASTMISAFSQSFYELLSINILITQIFLFIIVLYFLVSGLNKIIFLNSLLSPIMFFGILFIGIYLLLFNTTETVTYINKTDLNYMLAPLFAILYVSFNSLTIVPMMSNLYEYLDSNKTILISSILSGLILFILAICLLIPMILNFDIVSISDLPILTLLNNKTFFKILYSIILLLAIFGTLISVSISLVFSIEKKLKFKKSNIAIKIIFLFLAISFSNLGFSTFVNIVYPIFGFLGIIQIYFILKY